MDKRTELDEELERLTEAFREELKKQRNNDNFDVEYELIQQLQEEDEEENPISEDELCTCCGAERRDFSRGEDYQYCEKCREAMKHYPFSIHHFFIVASVVFASVFSVLIFVGNFNGFKSIYNAHKFEKENKLTSAIGAYDEAVSAFSDSTSGKSYKCKSLYLRVADDLYRSMPAGANSMSAVITCIEKGLSSFKAGLPIYSEYVDMYNDCKVMESTYEKITELAQNEKYAAFTGEDDKTYNELMNDMEELLSQTVTVTALNNSKSLNEFPCSEMIVRYFQYMLSYSCKKTEQAYKYLSLAKEANSSAVWLYGYDLGTMEIQNGNTEKAFEYAKLMKQNDYENSYAYILEAAAHRKNGNLKKSLASCEKGFDMGAVSPDLYRQKAMTLILQEKFKEAEKECKTALETEQYGALYFVYLIAATEAKDADAVKEINTALGDMGISYTEKMQDYIDGKITYTEVLTTGTGDIE